MPYADARLVRKFETALQAVWCESANLISRRVSERAVTHRLASYLQESFRTYDVDCEYNRNFNDPKSVIVRLSELSARHRRRVVDAQRRRQVSEEEIELQVQTEISPFPDIIVHRRMSNDHNLLIVEVKFSGDQRGEEGERYDHEKLRAFTSPDQEYSYQLGLFVELDSNRDTAMLTQFKNGNQIGELRRIQRQ